MTKTINFKIDWLLLFIVLLPTFYAPNNDLRNLQMNFFQISIIILIAMFQVNKFIGLFLGWSVLQFLFFKDLPRQSIVIQNIFSGAILYHFITKYTTPSKKYFWAFYAVLMLSVFWIPLQMNNIDPIWGMMDMKIQSTMTEYPGFFALPAFMGNYAAAVLPFAFALNPFLAAFALIALFFSKSSFSILAALGGALFFYWFRKRIVFWIILLVFGLSSFFYILKFDAPNGQFQRRFSAWGLVIQQSFQKQFFGHGIGSYGTAYKFVEVSPSLHNAEIKSPKEFMIFLANEAMAEKKQDLVKFLMAQSADNPNFGLVQTELRKNGMDFHEWNPAHNEFLQVFFDSGLVGLLIVFGYIFDIFRRFFFYGLQKDPVALTLAASFVSIILVSFAHFPFHLARLGGVFIVILAMLETCILRAEE